MMKVFTFINKFTGEGSLGFPGIKKEIKSVSVHQIIVKAIEKKNQFQDQKATKTTKLH